MKTKDFAIKLRTLLPLFISTGIACGIWAATAPFIGLISWAGFAGCTTYFSCGKHGVSGFVASSLTNLVGVLCGLATIYFDVLIPGLQGWGVGCAVFTFAMCVLSCFRLLSFCPGIFMGCFCVFGANGDLKALIPSLIVGAALGVLCESGGNWIKTFFVKKSASQLN